MSNFSFNLNDEEKKYLKELVTWSLLYYFERGGNPASREVPAPPENSPLRQELGAFVTLTEDGELRGCIGQIVGHGPLYLAVAQMAQAAAFQDSRFPPVQADELDLLDFEISVMGPIELCPHWEKIEIGKHGLIIKNGQHQGLLLPQVASDRNWSREVFLENLCRKAGLEASQWEDNSSQIYWFECVIVK